MTRTIIPAAILSLFVTAAFAATPTFQEADTNADGWVTPEEFAVALPDATDVDFVTIDTNGDGAISEAEMITYTSTLPDNG